MKRETWSTLLSNTSEDLNVCSRKVHNFCLKACALYNRDKELHSDTLCKILIGNIANRLRIGGYDLEERARILLVRMGFNTLNSPDGPVSDGFLIFVIHFVHRQRRDGLHLKIWQTHLSLNDYHRIPQVSDSKSRESSRLRVRKHCFHSTTDGTYALEEEMAERGRTSVVPNINISVVFSPEYSCKSIW